jgi:hypothetical protein
LHRISLILSQTTNQTSLFTRLEAFVAELFPLYESGLF